MTTCWALRRATRGRSTVWTVNEGNVDSAGGTATVSTDARYAGDFTPDPGHAVLDTLTQLYIDAKTPVTQDPSMGGFVQSYEGKTHNPQDAHRIMECFAPVKLPISVSLAQQFCGCDRWFASIPGPTFPNRAYAHGATSVGRVDMGVDWLNISKTIYELLAENNVDSRIYYHDSTMAMTFKGLMNQGQSCDQIFTQTAARIDRRRTVFLSRATPTPSTTPPTPFSRPATSTPITTWKRENC